MLFAMLALLAAPDAYLDQSHAEWEQVAKQIWQFHETALQEGKSSALLEDVLEKNGFKVHRGVGQEPTAFVATAGSGKPVIAILAEYDALPELSQKAGEARKEAGGARGGARAHAGENNVLGPGAGGGAVAPTRERAERKLSGTIQVFGTPAEE